jgi:CBS domain-containing protein
MKTIQRLVEGREVQCVDKAESVQQACERMAEHRVGALVVLDGEQVVGIFTERDLLTRVVAAGLDARETPVDAVMSSRLVVSSPSDTYTACLERMTRARCRHLPVVADGKLVGIVSLRDLLQVEVAETREEIAFLHQYITR